MRSTLTGARSAFATYQTIRWTLLVLLAWGVPGKARADDLTGKWQASPLRVSWAIGDWGKACGPQPSGGGEKGGTVQITSTGSTGFTLQGLGRNYSSGQCWEQMPGLAPRGKTLSPSTIQTTCRMPTGDPRQAKVVTSWYPRGNEIYFDETGQYQFVVSGSNCTASVRRTRVLTRVVEQQAPGEALATDSDFSNPALEERGGKVSPQNQTKTPDRPPPPERSTRCGAPGVPVRAEVTPRSKLMRPGETFHFQALARDAKGCRVPIPTKWELKSGSGVKLEQSGVLTVASDAAPGPVTLLAQMGDQKVEVGARIVTEAEYENLIAGGEYGAQGESLDTAIVELASSHVEFEKTRQPQKTGKGPLWWGAWAALVAVLAGLLIYLLKRRPPNVSNETGGTTSPRPSLTPGEELAQTQAAVGPPPAENTQPRRLCPVCGRRYDENTTFCVDDGARLMRVN